MDLNSVKKRISESKKFPVIKYFVNCVSIPFEMGFGYFLVFQIPNTISNYRSPIDALTVVITTYCAARLIIHGAKRYHGTHDFPEDEESNIVQTSNSAMSLYSMESRQTGQCSPRATRF